MRRCSAPTPPAACSCSRLRYFAVVSSTAKHATAAAHQRNAGEARARSCDASGRAWVEDRGLRGVGWRTIEHLPEKWAPISGPPGSTRDRYSMLLKSAEADLSGFPQKMRPLKESGARSRFESNGNALQQNQREDTMRAFVRTILIAATLMSPAGMAPAADIRVLSVGAVQNAVRALAAEFQQDTGHNDRPHLRLARRAIAQKIKDGRDVRRGHRLRTRNGRLDRDGIVNPESRRSARQYRSRHCSARGRARADPVDPGGLQAGTAGGEAPSSTATRALPNQSGEKAEKVLASAGHSRRAQGKAADRSRASR